MVRAQFLNILSQLTLLYSHVKRVMAISIACVWNAWFRVSIKSCYCDAWKMHRHYCFPTENAVKKAHVFLAQLIYERCSTREKMYCSVVVLWFNCLVHWVDSHFCFVSIAVCFGFSTQDFHNRLWFSLLPYDWIYSAGFFWHSCWFFILCLNQGKFSTVYDPFPVWKDRLYWSLAYLNFYK